MKRYTLLFAAVFTAGITTTFSQSKEAEKYKKQSEDMRAQVWNWQNASFKVREIPAQYAKSSKVIIAQHTELTADSRSKFSFFEGGSNKEQTLTEIQREIVKLNDKTAVNEYSELSYRQLSSNNSFYNADKTTAYIGVRVIKPSGATKEINADDIVLTKNETKDRRAKLAVPDLEPGDIIDFFIARERVMTNDYSEKPYYLELYDGSPILNYSFHAQLGKKFAVEFRSYNGAPDPIVSKNEAGDIVMDVEKKDIIPFETSLWVSSAKQLPFVRVNIHMTSKSALKRGDAYAKPGEALKIATNERYIDEKADQISSSYTTNYLYYGAKAEYESLISLAKKKAKQMGVDYYSMNNEDKAALLYYTLRFSKLLDFNITDMQRKINIGNLEFNGLAIPLYCLFKAANLDPSILVSETRFGPRFNEIMDPDDLESIVYMTDSKKYISLQSVYDVPLATPSEIEGIKDTKSFSFFSKGVEMRGEKHGIVYVDNGPKVLVSPADQNSRTENLSMSLNADKTGLSVKRSTTLKGFYKGDEQKDLILYEDFYEYERKSFHEEKSLMELLDDNRQSRKYLEEVQSAFADARKKQKDAFESEIKEWFDLEISDLRDYRIEKPGVRHTDPDFVYSSSFNAGGMIKKAGNNYIVDIGKVQGQPLLIKDEQRKRSIDVYAPFARSINYNITIDIPDGYTAEGVAALNVKEQNETGYFTVEASSTDKQVTIKVRKAYLNNYEPAVNFSKMIAFMDASGKWSNAKLLFRKK